MPSEIFKLSIDSKSHRSMDENGFLTVTNCPLTKEQVAPYRGYEIPDWEFNNLDPRKIYHVYRPASELQKPKTINSINLIPIQLEHHVEDPEQPPTKTRIGSTGENGEWAAPYLTNTLKFFNADAIRRIQDGSMKELSLGYWYKPDFTSGTTESGEHYDLIMRDIVANHIALVEEGRAGPDVMVRDSKPSCLSEEVFQSEGNKPMDEKQKAQMIDALMSAVKTALLTSLNGTDPNSATNAAALNSDEDDPAINEEQNLSDADTDESLEPDEVQEQESDADTSAEDEDETTSDEDEQACDEDEQACDEDEEVAADEDEATEDEDEDEPTSDEDDDATEDEDDYATEDEDEPAEDEGDISPELLEALKAAGIDPKDTEAVGVFAKGIEYAMKNNKQKAATGDSSKGLRRKIRVPNRTSMKLQALARDAKSYARTKHNKYNLTQQVNASVQKRLQAAYRAADEVKSVLGKINPVAYDSAGDIYKDALRKCGMKVPAGMSSQSARNAFFAYRKGLRTATVDSNRSVRMSQMSSGNAAILNQIERKLYRG